MTSLSLRWLAAAVLGSGLVAQTDSRPAQSNAARPTIAFVRVVDEAGEPREGVTVIARSSPYPGIPRQVAVTLPRKPFIERGRWRTDARGQVVVKLPRDLECELLAETEHSRSSVHWPVSAGVRYELVLKPLRTVRGRVVRISSGDEVPAGNVPVASGGTVRSPHSGNQPMVLEGIGVTEQAVSAQDGSFSVRLRAGAGSKCAFGC